MPVVFHLKKTHIFRFSFLSIPFQDKFYHEFRFNKVKNAIKWIRHTEIVNYMNINTNT